MTDYSELKRLAEACGNQNWRFLTEKLTEYGIRDDHGYIAFLPVGHPAKYGACAAREAKARFLGAMTPETVLALIAENDRLRQFEEAHMVWLEKTEWVQASAQALELGQHRADVLRSRIDQLKTENTSLHQKLGMAQRDGDACITNRDALRTMLGLVPGQNLHERVETLRKDAERYQWLRDGCGLVEYKAIAGSIGPGMLPSGEKLESAIDAAMGKGALHD